MPDLAQPKKANPLLVTCLIVFALALVIGVAVLVVHPGTVRTTDAQIDGHIYPINTRVGGTITWVNQSVEDTRFVGAGTPLAHLDPDDYQPAVSRLEGELEASRALKKSADLNVPIASAGARSRLAAARAAVMDAEADLDASTAQENAAQAAIRQAEATFKRADADRLRYQALLGTHEISRSEYDQRFTDAKTAEEVVAAAEANREAAKHRSESMRQRIAQRREELRSAETAPDQIATATSNVKHAEGEVRRSRASLRDAQLNLSYTEIVAPVGGIVGRKSMEVGQRVTSGQLMLTLVKPHDVWVIANFRETQLRHMRVGQSATVHVDSYDRNMRGIVESIGGATGSKYAVVAPDNATGNYVKVVQRIPVRIRILDRDVPDQVLLPGMSIEVDVKTSGTL